MARSGALTQAGKYPFIIIVLTWVLAGYLTALFCQFSLRRAKRPSWLIAPATSCLGVIGPLGTLFPADPAESPHWSNRFDPLIMIPLTGAGSVLVALVAALCVLSVYRNKYAIRHRER